MNPLSSTSSGAPMGAPVPLRAPSESVGDRFRDHLRALAGNERQLDASFRAGLRADATDSATLLRLQANVYRYSLELDLAGRLVERASSAVRQVLQSQG